MPPARRLAKTLGFTMRFRWQTQSITFLLALIAFPALAQTSGSSECELDGNQPELNECANFRFAKTDTEMNRLYQAQISHLSGGSKGRLRASQRAWLTYRDKACLYETRPREESGSIWPMQDSLCRESLTKQRIEVLKTYVECRQNGCPE